MKKIPLEILRWIYNRMIHIHKENPNVDYMISFDKVIKYAENEMEIDKIASLQLQSDDILVLNYGGKLNKSAFARLKEQLETYFSNIKSCILEQGMTLQVLKPALKWTSDLPTQEGWYWCKFNDKDEITFAHFDGTFWENSGAWESCDSVINEWYGPIEPPEYKESL